MNTDFTPLFNLTAGWINSCLPLFGVGIGLGAISTYAVHYKEKQAFNRDQAILWPEREDMRKKCEKKWPSENDVQVIAGTGIVAAYWPITMPIMGTLWVHDFMKSLDKYKNKD
jgi:hypothetical protein